MSNKMIDLPVLKSLKHTIDWLVTDFETLSEKEKIDRWDEIFKLVEFIDEFAGRVCRDVVKLAGEETNGGIDVLTEMPKMRNKVCYWLRWTDGILVLSKLRSKKKRHKTYGRNGKTIGKTREET